MQAKAVPAAKPSEKFLDRLLCISRHDNWIRKFDLLERRDRQFDDSLIAAPAKLCKADGNNSRAGGSVCSGGSCRSRIDSTTSTTSTVTEGNNGLARHPKTAIELPRRFGVHP